MKTIEMPVYNLKGEKVQTINLCEEIFGREINIKLLHEVVISQQSNRRQISAKTKGRGEVSGGGIKPWRQKGTGRARHGSIRSPLWIGGGVTFGPTTERNFKKKINKKKKQIALFMALSSKVKDAELCLIDNLQIEGVKTKMTVDFLSNLPLGWDKKSKKNKSVLFALCREEKNVILSSRNIPRVKTMPVVNLNTLDILSSKYLLLSLAGVKEIEEHFYCEQSEQQGCGAKRTGSYCEQSEQQGSGAKRTGSYCEQSEQQGSGAKRTGSYSKDKTITATEDVKNKIHQQSQ
jgi:large subunit ribosomal protein L4